MLNLSDTAACAATAGAVSPLLAAPCATRVICDFEVRVTDGLLAGNRYQGSFSCASSALSGERSEPAEVLYLTFDFLGKTYSSADGAVEMLWQDGRLLGLRACLGGAFKVSFLGEAFDYDIQDHDGYGTFGRGRVTYRLRSASSPAAPRRRSLTSPGLRRA